VNEVPECKVYEGKTLDAHLGKRVVTVNGEPLYNYYEPGFQDPRAFTWGYRGHGPHTLAASILCDYFGVSQGNRVAGPEFHCICYLSYFLDEHVKKWPPNGDFRITSEEISAWITSKSPVAELIEAR
jgi:hypothetical protein